MGLGKYAPTPGLVRALAQGGGISADSPHLPASYCELAETVQPNDMKLEPRCTLNIGVFVRLVELMDQ